MLRRKGHFTKAGGGKLGTETPATKRGTSLITQLFWVAVSHYLVNCTKHGKTNSRSIYYQHKHYTHCPAPALRMTRKSLGGRRIIWREVAPGTRPRLGGERKGHGRD